MGRTNQWPDLQDAFEDAERRDWDRYALGRHLASAAELRPRIAALLTDANVPSLRERAALLVIDADAQIMEAAALVDALEERGGDPTVELVELFARKEQHARRSGHVGYADLALAADGFSRAEVTDELEAAERAARRDATQEMVLDETERLPREKDVLDRLRAFLSPVLDGGEVRLNTRAAVAGMCKALHWPDRIAVLVRAAAPDACMSDRLACLSTMAHELGHAAQWRARAARGLGFVDFFSLTAADEETAADLTERLLFEGGVGDDLAPLRSLWAEQRATAALRQIGQARFECAAYAAALDAPTALSTLWARHVDRADPDGWSRDGHGFYTEDSMRRYAYPLAYVRSASLLAALDRPLVPEAVIRAL